MMRNELAKMESKVQVIEMTFPNHMQSNTHCKTNLQKKKKYPRKRIGERKERRSLLLLACDKCQTNERIIDFGEEDSELVTGW